MDFVFRSNSMQALIARVKFLASTEAHVFITGESGVGKKALARLIHDGTGSDTAPLVCVHCSSLENDEGKDNAGSLQSKGFDTAKRLQESIASASGGTLLLDEIENLGRNAQQALLEHLLEHELPTRRNGAHRRPMRCICTSRVNPAVLARGDFREDLFHRLYELHLTIPPLRDRVDDIPALAEHFLLQLQQQMATTMTLEPAALARLQKHDWPGNVRELRNTLFRACFVSNHETLGLVEVEASILPSAVEAPQQYDQLKLADVERRVILRRLDRFHGNKAKAAIDLGVTDRTLRNKMRQYRESGQLEK